MDLFKIVNTDQVYFDMHVCGSHGGYLGCMVSAWGDPSHHWAGILFYVQLVSKIVTPCLTGLAFLTGPYSGIVQELTN